MVWYGPTSETAWMQRRETNWLPCSDFTELKKISSRICPNCSNYYFLFSSPSNFVAVRFVSLKNVQLTVQAYCSCYFLLHNKFSKRTVKSGIFGELYCFFYVPFLENKRVFFWLGPITSTLKIIMDVYLIFWAKFQNSPISTCLIYSSWFYDASLVSRFTFCATTVAHLCLQCVLRFALRQFRGIDNNGSHKPLSVLSP